MVFRRRNPNGYVSTGLIPFPAYSITPKGTFPYVSPVLYVTGNLLWESDKSTCRIGSVTSDGAECHGKTATSNPYYHVEELVTGYYKITYQTELNGSGDTVLKIDNWIGKYPDKVRLSMKGSGEGLIVTPNEPIG